MGTPTYADALNIQPAWHFFPLRLSLWHQEYLFCLWPHSSMPAPLPQYPAHIQTQTSMQLLTNHSLKFFLKYLWGFPCGSSGKESTSQCRSHQRCGFDPWVGKMPWRRKQQATPVFLPGKACGQRSLVVYSPWGFKRVGHTWAHAH